MDKVEQESCNNRTNPAVEYGQHKAFLLCAGCGVVDSQFSPLPTTSLPPNGVDSCRDKALRVALGTLESRNDQSLSQTCAYMNLLFLSDNKLGETVMISDKNVARVPMVRGGDHDTTGCLQDD